MKAIVLLQVAALGCLLAAAWAQTDNKDVKRPPTITKDYHKVHRKKLEIFQPKETVQLPCEATGAPTPKYSWKRNGNDVVYSRFIQKDRTTGNLRIEGISEREEGEYQCFASNAYGTAMSAPVMIQVAKLNPFGIKDTVIERVNEGLPARLACDQLQSTPMGRVAWAYGTFESDPNPTPVETNRRVGIDQDGNLHFAYTTIDDNQGGGVYKCTVFNPVLDVTVGGSYTRLEVTGTTEGNVNYRPKSVFKTASPKVAVVGKTLTLQCLFSGKPAPKVEWRKINGNLDSRVSYRGDQELIIEPVMDEDQGEYSCMGTSSMGNVEQRIRVEVESAPTWKEIPTNINKTQGQNVKFLCKGHGEPLPTTQWYQNAEPLAAPMPPRMSINDKQDELTVSDLSKATDLMNIQCKITNKHGYLFADAYLNVVEPTIITRTPRDHTLTEDERTVIFPCEAVTDPSMPLAIDWMYNDHQVSDEPGIRFKQQVDNSLVIEMENIKRDDRDLGYFAGKYTCVASNGLPAGVARSDAYLDIPGVQPVVASAGFTLWWVILLVAIILLLLILILCCCLCYQKNKGDTYPVDEKERKAGNDPEKELADSGFMDYTRPEDEPFKGSRASITSSIKLESDDEEASLAEYGDIDTGKFNEDGSFIGQYRDDKKKKQQQRDESMV